LDDHGGAGAGEGADESLDENNLIFFPSCPFQNGPFCSICEHVD